MTPRFAWPSYKEQWDCRVLELLLDEQEANELIDNDYLRLQLYDREWATARVRLSIHTDEVAPPGCENPTAHVLVSCPSTQLRRVFPMEPAADGAGFEVTLKLPRSTLAEKATISAEIAADLDGRRRIVGSAVNWAVIVDIGDAPPRPSGPPPLRSAWVDFGSSEAPSEARRNAAGYCYIDLTQSPPMLYLNSGIDGFQSLIMAENAKTERRRHRDMLGAMVARQVANTLFRAACAEVIPGDYGAPATGPTTPVLRSMCEAVAAELPDTDSTQDLYERIASLPANPNAAAAFWSEVDLTLDRMTGLSDTIVRVCAEAKHV